MQPSIDEVKYVSERSLDALGEEVTQLLKSEEDHWELFGDVKVTDKEYINPCPSLFRFSCHGYQEFQL